MQRDGLKQEFSRHSVAPFIEVSSDMDDKQSSVTRHPNDPMEQEPLLATILYFMVLIIPRSDVIPSRAQWVRCNRMVSERRQHKLHIANSEYISQKYSPCLWIMAFLWLSLL